jgi:tetratricopeptide (TPR) repeat protein
MAKSLKSVVLTLALAGGLAISPNAYANARAAAQTPAEQTRSDASRTAIERERRYVGLSLADAIRQSLIDDDLDFAFSTLSALGRTSGDSTSANYFTGVRAFAKGDYSDALEALKSADTDDMLIASVRTWAMVGLGQASDAAAIWDRYSDSGRKPFYATYRALLAEQDGQIDTALRQYRIAESTGELMFAKDLVKRYTVLLVKAGEDRQALKTFDAIFGETKALDSDEAAFRKSLVEKQPETLPPITPHSAVSGLMSNYASAGILVRRLRPDPDAADKARSEKRSDPDAIFVNDALTLRTALLVDPANFDARLALARLLADADEEEAAGKTLEAIVSGPLLNQARLALAGIYNSLENPRGGIELLDAIPTPARDADWWDRRSDLLITRGDYKGALNAARRSVVLTKGGGQWAQDIAKITFANALLHAGQEGEVISIAKELVTRLEKSNPIRGVAAKLLMRFEATRAIGQVALRDSLSAFGSDGRTKIGVGSALAKDPATRAEGIELVRDGASEFPRSPEIMNALGYNLVTYDVDLDEGFRILQKAHQARPNSGAIMDSFGLAHYKLGNLDEAQRLIEGAVTLRQGSPDPEIYDNLGDVYWHQGRKDDARAQWRRAKDIGGAYEGLDALAGKMRDGLTTPAPTKRNVPVILEPGSV